MANKVLQEKIELLERELEREKLAHFETEQIAEKTTLDLYKSNNQLKTIFDITKDGIAIVDLETNFLEFNDAYLNMTGFTKEELLTKSCADLSAPEDYERAVCIIKEVIEKGHVSNFEKTCIVKDGRRLAVNMSFSLMPDKKRILVSTKDVTEKKRKDKIIQDYIQLIDMSVITSSTDLKGNITYVSDAFCEISGYTKEEMIGNNHRLVRHPDMDDSLYKELWETISLGMVWVGEMKNLKKDGDYYWVQASVSPTYDEYGKKTGYTSVRQDITDKKKLEQISITDGLTNIYNRRYFDHVFSNKYNNTKRETTLEFFLILDIDHFKLYNDHYGHQYGDEALRNVARSLQKSLKREDDYCFRLGGEEFGVLFRADSKEKGLEFAEQIRGNIENLKIEHCKNSVSPYITISSGLVILTGTNNSINSRTNIYKKADELLYEAKKAGRNQVKYNIFE